MPVQEKNRKVSKEVWLTEEFSDDLKFQKNKDVFKEDYTKVGTINDKVQNVLDCVKDNYKGFFRYVQKKRKRICLVKMSIC